MKMLFVELAAGRSEREESNLPWLCESLTCKTMHEYQISLKPSRSRSIQPHPSRIIQHWVEAKVSPLILIISLPFALYLITNLRGMCNDTSGMLEEGG